MREPSQPNHTHCMVPMCNHECISSDMPFCENHVPISGFVTNDQRTRAKQLMKRGATLYQAAVRTRCDVRDLDIALWRHLGEPKQPEPMF